jgi:error-prone DNA polymerase
VRLAEAARGSGLSTVFGAELSVGAQRPRAGETDPGGTHLLVLANGARGYRRLSAAIGAAHLAGGHKGLPSYNLEGLAGAAGGHWVVLSGCRKCAVRRALEAGGPEAAVAQVRTLVELFGAGNVAVEPHRSTSARR